MLPVNINLEGKDVLVVGGGVVATRRVRTLQEQGALVHVVAPDISEELHQLHAEQKIIWHHRFFEPKDAADKWLVVAHTDSSRVQQQIKDACETHRVWCLVGGQPENSSFWFMAHRVLEDITVAVSAKANPKKVKRLGGEIAGFLSHTS